MLTRFLLLSGRLRLATIQSCLRGLKCEFHTSLPADPARARDLDIAVVDVTGPEQVTLIRQLRQQNPSLVILALVSFGDSDHEQKAIGCGVDDVLSMPMTDTRLKLTLQNLIRLRMLERIMGATKRLVA